MPRTSTLADRAAPRRLFLAGCASTLAFPVVATAQTVAAPDQFELKASGYANATGSEGGSQQDAADGVQGEAGLELTPQYRLRSGTVLALRGAASIQTVASRPNGSYRLSIPEVSAFAIGSFGRIEIGERAGFPQSLVGFTPSEIAFATAGFGPESGARLDPNGGLPTGVLPRGLASRIDALTYLGYAARFYSDASPKIIYLTPRARSGLYGAISFTPSTVRPQSFTISEQERGHNGDVDNSLGSARAHNVLQAAFVWNHRTAAIDLSLGATYSHADLVPTGASHLSPRHTNSISGGVSITLRDTWSVGLSATYDGPVRIVDPVAGGSTPTKPFGVVASADYVAGPWTVGGYYQRASADSQTIVPVRDTVSIGEFGASYLLDRNHDLLGRAFHTDVELYASVYLYRFESGVTDSDELRRSGQVLLAGARFSFF